MSIIHNQTYKIHTPYNVKGKLRKVQVWGNRKVQVVSNQSAVVTQIRLNECLFTHLKWLAIPCLNALTNDHTTTQQPLSDSWSCLATSCLLLGNDSCVLERMVTPPPSWLCLLVSFLLSKSDNCVESRQLKSGS